MSPDTERRLLQLATAIACIVPIGMGVESIIAGPSVIRGIEPPLPVDLDSHFRYLSGLLLGVGLLFLASIPRIERHTILFRALGVIVVVGGLARLVSLVSVGVPGDGHRFGLVMELVVVPLIVLWQARVARRCAGIR